MKKWSLLSLVLSLALLTFAGSALAAPAASKKAAAKITVTSIMKAREAGNFYVETNAATTAAAVSKGLTIAGKGIKWAAAPGSKNGKVFQGTFTASLKTDYALKASGSFVFGKNVSGALRWNMVGVDIKSFSFAPEPGTFTLTLMKSAKAADIQGKIAVTAGGVKLPVSITGSGTLFTVKAAGAKAGVAYKISFSEPFETFSLTQIWAVQPAPLPDLPSDEGGVAGDVYQA